MNEAEYKNLIQNNVKELRDYLWKLIKPYKTRITRHNMRGLVINDYDKGYRLINVDSSKQG